MMGRQVETWAVIIDGTDRNHCYRCRVGSIDEIQNGEHLKQLRCNNGQRDAEQKTLQVAHCYPASPRSSNKCKKHFLNQSFTVANSSTRM